MRYLICRGVLAGLLVMSGCVGGPKSYRGNRIHPLRHKIDQVESFSDHLSVTGSLNRNVAVSFYGARVESAVDDRGRKLEMKSARIFVTKDMSFEIELTPASEGAKTVTLDIRFDSHDGLERLGGTYPIEPGSGSYRNLHQEWFTHETPCPACSRPRKD